MWRNNTFEFMSKIHMYCVAEMSTEVASAASLGLPGLQIHKSYYGETLQFCFVFIKIKQ